MKQYHRYQMDFSSRWVKWSGIFMGISVFALAVYYFFMADFLTVSVPVLLFRLWLPMLLGIAYIVLIRLIQWNAPGIYGILGAALCVACMIGDILSGGTARVLLAIFGFLICGGVLLICVGGYLPGRLPASVLLAVTVVLRILILDISGISGWVQESAVLCVMLALMCLPMTMKPGKTRHT